MPATGAFSGTPASIIESAPPQGETVHAIGEHEDMVRRLGHGGGILEQELEQVDGCFVEPVLFRQLRGDGEVRATDELEE